MPAKIGRLEHAFDLERIAGPMEVRQAFPSWTFQEHLQWLCEKRNRGLLEVASRLSHAVLSRRWRCIHLVHIPWADGFRGQQALTSRGVGGEGLEFPESEKSPFELDLLPAWQSRLAVSNPENSVQASAPRLPWRLVSSAGCTEVFERFVQRPWSPTRCR